MKNVNSDVEDLYLLFNFGLGSSISEMTFFIKNWLKNSKFHFYVWKRCLNAKFKFLGHFSMKNVKSDVDGLYLLFNFVLGLSTSDLTFFIKKWSKNSNFPYNIYKNWGVCYNFETHFFQIFGQNFYLLKRHLRFFRISTRLSTMLYHPVMTDF